MITSIFLSLAITSSPGTWNYQIDDTGAATKALPEEVLATQVIRRDGLGQRKIIPTYVAIEIGSDHWPLNMVSSINSRGSYVGLGWGSPGEAQGLFGANLKSLSGMPIPMGFMGAMPDRISSDGFAVGFTWDAPLPNTTRGVVWNLKSQTYKLLAKLRNGPHAHAYAMSEDLDYVGGDAIDSDHRVRAVIWDRQTGALKFELHGSGIGGPHSLINSMAESGEAVGYGAFRHNVYDLHGTYWAVSSEGIYSKMMDLGSLYPEILNYSWAYDVARIDSHTVLAVGETGGNYPVVWEISDHSGTDGDESLRSRAAPTQNSVSGRGGIRAVNSSRHMAGWSLDEFGQIVATLWKDGTAFDLNDLSINASGSNIDALVEAWDMNDKGWIVGRGVRDGIWVGYVLIPLAQLSN